MTLPDKSNLEKDISTYLKLGWPVLPLHYPKKPNECSCGKLACENIGKHPRTEHGLNDATTDERVIESWQRRWDFFNVGVLTNGLVVVDIDPRHGGDDSLYDIEKKYTLMPETVNTLTGGGGQHLIYKAPPGKKIKNKVGLAPGLDIRANGGYVVAPHSLHKSGRNYYFEVGYGPDEIEMAEAPSWLISLIEDDGKSNGHSVEHWRNIIHSKIVEGSRNKTLTSIAGHLFRKYVDPFVVLQLLNDWNARHCVPPLSEDVVIKTLTSVAKTEMRRREKGKCS